MAIDAKAANSEAQVLERLGRYEILTRLAAGGMAELFLACLRGPGGFRKFVALKKIRSELRDEEDFVAMFLDEARITAAMSHANIAQVFELGEVGRDLFIAMEFIAGQDTHRIVRAAKQAKLRLPVPFAATIGRDLLSALHYAHTFTSPGGRPLPIIHRDVSTRNVMVTYGGTVKVVDFGIAKARGCINTTKVGSVKGSPAYMSPEQIRGDPLDGRSDVFAASAVFYEALTGLRAFQAPTDSAIMYRVLSANVDPPRALNPEVPEALSDVVMRGLAKSPDDRFANAKDMSLAIEAAAPALWREDACARFMTDLFADARERTRALLAMADEVDSGRVVEMAEALGDLRLTPSGHYRLDSSESQQPTRKLEPSERAAPEPAPRRTAPPASIAPDRKAVILAVDDSQVLRTLVERLLSAAGHEVVLASSAAEALEVLGQLCPDLILLDVIMPEVDGFELARNIRQISHFRTTPLLFLSAACSLEERVKGISVGGDEFIRKPFEGADLVARVRTHLERVWMLKSASN